MTDEEILTVVQAHKDGKQIQCRSIGCDGEWEDTYSPKWNFWANEYRIKPEPHYVPYDSVNEVERDKWVKRKGTSSIRRIDGLKHEKGCKPCVSVNCVLRTLQEMFNMFEYEDGTPFGKQVSE